MDPLRSLPGVTGPLTVGERRGGQKQADAFRRALQQETGQDARSRSAPPPPRTATTRPDEGSLHHVDVIA